MAISETRKKELVAEYREWINKSQAVIITKYMGMTMKDLDVLRAKVREVGGEFHVVKNTLSQIAFKEAGMPLSEGVFEGSTAIGFAFKDAPAFAKAVTEFSRTSEFFKVKGGYLHNRPMSPDQVKSLAELPPLPIVRAQLLGALNAPASQLARILSEPGRGLAAVIKSFAEKETTTSTDIVSE